jgi:transposase-like protein
MYDVVESCPFCGQNKPVVYWSKNRGGTQRYRCNACHKTFTAKPDSNRITPQKEQLIERALEERLSIEAIARLTKSAKRTVYNVLKKRQSPASPS